MIILTIRTDNPEAEVGLFEDSQKIAYENWHAHRELSTTLHQKIENVLKGYDKKLEDVAGIVVFQGPGSFTGLRIGITVANTNAYALGVPIVGARGDDWLETGIRRLLAAENDQVVLPEYGAPVHITLQKR